MKLARWTLVALAPLALASACFGSLGRTPPAKQRFVLQASEPSAPLTDGAALGVVRVSRVRVSPVFENKGFVYRTGASTFETDFYNEFFSPPGVLLREALLQWLNATQLFVAVGRQSGADVDWVLEAEVSELFIDQRAPIAPEACLEIAFRLIDARTRALAFEKRYSVRERASSSSSAALVDAWNRALGRTLEELAADLRAALAAPRASVRAP
jgi:cholesterol transport system auxiliary component